MRSTKNVQQFSESFQRLKTGQSLAPAGPLPFLALGDLPPESLMASPLHALLEAMASYHSEWTALAAPQDGGAENRPQGKADDATRAVDERTERQRFEAVKAELERMMRDGALRDAVGNLQIEITPEGLRLQIFDRDDTAIVEAIKAMLSKHGPNAGQPKSL